MSARENLLEQIHRRGIQDQRVLSALERVPREEFVLEEEIPWAYRDAPLSIGEGQTISQPSLVAYMTSRLQLDDLSRVLEVGTGCGYQTAVLAELAAEVYSIEIRRGLAQAAQTRLRRLGYTNIHFRIGDGRAGWAEAAPFDAIIVTAAAKKVPQALVEQLRVNARLLIPLDADHDQELYEITRTKEGSRAHKLMRVRFVPMVDEKTPPKL